MTTGRILRCSCCQRMLSEEQFPPKAFHTSKYVDKQGKEHRYKTPSNRGRGYICRACLKERRKGKVAGALFVLALAGAAWFASSCSSTPPPPPAVTDLLARSIAPDELVDGLLDRAVAMLDTGPVAGIVRQRYGRSACRPAHGVNPLWSPPSRPAYVGEWLELRASTRAGNLPPPPPDLCWLVASFAAPLAEPVDWTRFGMPGCLQLVAADYVVAVPARAAPAPAGMFQAWREGGHVGIRFRPSYAGQRLTLQLLVAAPGETPAGFLVSEAVEIIAQ